MSHLRPLSALLQILTALNGQAQSTEDSGKAAVNLMFTGMKNADAAKIRRSFADSAILQTITANAAGKTVARLETVEDFAIHIGKIGAGDADERIIDTRRKNACPVGAPDAP